VKAFLTVVEAAQELGVSDDTVYRLIGDGTLPSVKFRNRILVPLRAIELTIETAMAGFDPTRIASPQNQDDAGDPSEPRVPNSARPRSGGPPGSARLRMTAAS
jgi:excisionase family DNA binding protein